jgi:hypothetical protein
MAKLDNSAVMNVRGYRSPVLTLGTLRGSAFEIIAARVWYLKGTDGAAIGSFSQCLTNPAKRTYATDQRLRASKMMQMMRQQTGGSSLAGRACP